MKHLVRRKTFQLSLAKIWTKTGPGCDFALGNNYVYVHNTVEMKKKNAHETLHGNCITLVDIKCLD